jgi:hypothetical protein
VVPVAQDPEAGLVNVAVPGAIVCSLFGMLSAVQFHYQALFHAGEVGDVGTDRVLAAEPATFKPAPAQVLPQVAFGIGGIVA